MSGVVARAFRRLALPLASYYAVTLALPLANGATPSGAFMEHALVVLLVPPIAIILGCAALALARLVSSVMSDKSRQHNDVWRTIVNWPALLKR